MIDIDLSKTAEQMSDGELEMLVRLAELMKDAEKERHRRLDEADPNVRATTIEQPHVTTRTHANCPTCGKNDSFSMSRILYTSWEAGQNGERPVRAVLCSCGTWYNAATGERMEHDQMRKMFSY